MKREKFSFRSYINIPGLKDLKERRQSFAEAKRSRSWESLKDYRKYKPGPKQTMLYFICAVPLLLMLGMLFYRSLLISLIFCMGSVPLFSVYSSFMAEKRRERLLEGFRDALYSISSSVAAGRQMPAAMGSAARTSCETYGEQSDISVELLRISRNYELNHSDIGNMLEDLGNRSNISEIRQFAAAVRTCQLCGGNLEEVCLKSASLLLDKMSVSSEVKALISQKKLDIVLLAVMPVAVLGILNLLNYSYVSVLYECIAGRVVMSICLLLMAFALLWGLRITEIEL